MENGRHRQCWRIEVKGANKTPFSGSGATGDGGPRAPCQGAQQLRVGKENEIRWNREWTYPDPSLPGGRKGIQPLPIVTNRTENHPPGKNSLPETKANDIAISKQ